MTELLTHSRMACAKTCLRKHYYRYELGLSRIRDADVLRFGSAFHLGCELWSKGADSDAAILEVTKGYEVTPEWADPYAWQVERETVANLLAGYFWYYETDEMEYIEVEQSFRMPLVNPDTNGKSRKFELAGKRDGIVTSPFPTTQQRLVVLERKTTGQDIGPDSDYWLRLRCDQQISLYLLAARQQYPEIQEVLYDVIRKPTIRPRQIPRLDNASLKIVLDEQGERVLNKTGKPRQTGGEGMTLQTSPETPEAYGERLLANITERPDFYFQRREIPRLEDDLNEFRAEVWQQAQLLQECKRRNLWFRNVSAMTCPYCEFKDICLQSTTVDPDNLPAGFVRLDDVHPELQEQDHDTSNSNESTPATATAS